MKNIIILVLMLLVLSTGVGLFVARLFKYEGKGFKAPLGFAVILAILQALYYPVQILNGPFKFIAMASLIVLFLSLIVSIIEYKGIIKDLWRKETLWVVLSLIAFLAVFYHCFLDLEFADGPMYLNYIAQNIINPSINKFHLYTGLVGQEWDGLYLYQGYYHFTSFLCWFINFPYYILHQSVYIPNIKVTVWAMGLLYSILSSMLIVNIIKSFTIEKKFEKIILFFTLFYSNFYYWRVAFAYYGNTYRTFFVTFLMFLIVEWLHLSVKNSKKLIPFIVMAGFACSSTFLLVSFVALYSLAVYLFTIKEENAFHSCAIFVAPMVLYVAVMISRQSLVLGVAVGIIALLYYIFHQRLSTFINVIENFLFKHSKIIFYYVIPVIAIIVSFLINTFDKDCYLNYSYYFQDHQRYDMVKDYTFRYSNYIDNILNVIRWIGVIVILKCKNSYYKTVFIMMLILFMNPLTTTTIAYTIASNVFYRSVEVMFNPLTETLLLVTVYNLFKHNWQRYSLYFLLVVIVLIGHSTSYVGSKEGLYSYHVAGGKMVDPILKIERGEKEVIDILMEEQKQFDRQMVVISQANGLRTFIPTAYQLFTARDHWYAHTRLNEEFYQIARKHYPWQEPVETHYESTCKYVQEYNVDYMIIKYWENPEFDQSSDACTETMFTGAKYKLKKVVRSDK